MTPAIQNILQNIEHCWKEHKSKISKAPDKAIVETCFLSSHFATDYITAKYKGDGYASFSAYGHEDAVECNHIFAVTGDDPITGSTDNSLTFYYYAGEGLYTGSNYGLAIKDSDDNLIYWREPGQNPRTEWLINSLADDFKDENDNIVFEGDPVNI